MKNRTLLIRSILLSIPVILFIAHHYFFHAPGLIPTGFSLNDNVVYISNARQYLDADHFSFLYANPFDGKTGSPAIYFQPHNLLFALLMKSGLEPGYILSFFGLFFTVLSIFIGLKIIQQAYPAINHKGSIQLLFTWGGGLLAFTGFMVAMVVYKRVPPPLDSIYIADPANGWWGLSYGRTLFIAMESYYHFIFLFSVLLILKRKWKAALAAGIFLSISHPFTGIEYLAIICFWVFIEKLLLKNKIIPWYFIIGNAVIILLTAWYYLIYLNTFEEHAILQKQFSVRWTHSLYIIIPAYILVLLLSLLQHRLKKIIQNPFANSGQRLFLVWGVIAFLLSKHEWFIKPIQPIHFTRGYIWMGFFLFAVPALVWVLDKLKKLKYNNLALAVFLIIFLSDNILWTVNLLRGKNNTEWEGHITKNTQQVLKFLESNANNKDLLIGNATLVNYLANVYTPCNTWVSHPYNTPKKEERILQMQNFLQTGVKPAEWKDRRILIVLNKKMEPIKLFPPLESNKLFENNSYIIFTP